MAKAVADAAPTTIDATTPDAAASDDSHGGVATDGITTDAATADIAIDALTAYPRPRYTSLAETGLYSDFAKAVVAPGIIEFRPRFVLWSDAADKRRWIQLPPGAQIDTQNIDHWVFPIGTKFWKQFAHGKLLLETRLIERYGPGREDFWMGSFVWNADGTVATFAVDGAQNINGTQHDAPAQKVCSACHYGEPGRILGFSAMQLSGTPEGPTLHAIAAMNWLSHAPDAATEFSPPGDALTVAALGYLHANCGHCHNPDGTSWPDTQMNLRLDVASRTVEDAPAYKTAVGQKLTYFVRQPGLTLRIAPGDPSTSAVALRMQSRMPKQGMPPLATEIVDMTGVDLVTRWIASLPR